MTPSTGITTQARASPPGSVPPGIKHVGREGLAHPVAGDGAGGRDRLHHRAEPTGHSEECDDHDQPGDDHHQTLKGLGQDPADLTADDGVGGQDAEDDQRRRPRAPPHQVGEEIGAGLDLRREIGDTAEQQDDRDQGLDPPVVVEPQIRDIAEGRHRRHFGHGPHLLAEHHVSERKGRRTEHPEHDGVARHIDQPRDPDEGEGAGHRRHRRQRDGQRSEEPGGAEVGLGRADPAAGPQPDEERDRDHRHREGDDESPIHHPPPDFRSFSLATVVVNSSHCSSVIHSRRRAKKPRVRTTTPPIQ